MSLTIYFAAPLFTAAERAWNAAVVADLRAALPAVEILVPQEFCAVFDAAKHAGSSTDFAAVFAACRDNLVRATVVVAVLDGADCDSGTAWEVGHAYARGVPVIGWRSDWRPAEDGAANCMLSRSCRAIVADGAAVVTAVRALEQRPAPAP